MPADLKKARELFLHAVGKLPPEDWDGYVAGASGGDAELARQVSELLQVHRDAGSFLARPAAAVGATGAFAPEPEAAAAVVTPGEAPGTVIGPYKLMEQIGEGGMGLVFVAEQQHPVRRKVAVKVIKPGMDTREVIARFEAERQALALMDHPNIARVFDAGATESGRPYFVMELVRGVGITEFCDANRLTPRDRLALFVPVCQAVQHAHQKGIIHRDLKATNILVTLHDGTPVVKVIDFGVAKAIGQQLTEKTIYTRFAQMIGTPMYMSPEQAEMSGLDVDTRSDIYALGVLLYELLTGATPFDKERLRTASYDELRRIVREEEPPRPSQRLSTLLAAALTTVSARRNTEPARLKQVVRGELDWVVMKALEKDRNRRYETASAFAADVQRYLKDEPVQACPPSVRYRLRKFLRRYKGPVLAASIMVLALLAGIIGTTVGMIRATRAEGEAVDEAGQKQLALADKEVALAAARQSEGEAKDQLFLALLNQARSGRLSRRMGQRLDGLATLEKAARIRPDDRLRDEAMAAMALPDVRPGPSLHPMPPGIRLVAFDGPYQTYARVDDQGVISIRGVARDEEIRRINPGTNGRAASLRLSPDGRFLAVLNDQSGVQVWRVADGKPLPGEESRPCSALAFRPDSRQLAAATADSVVCIDLASGQEASRWRLPARAFSLAFHPTAARLAVGYASNKVVSIYDSARGSHVADLPVGPINQQDVAWHPDGTRLAVTGSDPRIQIWDVARQRRLAILEGHVEPAAGLTFHPDGSLLASGSSEGVVRLWDPATGRQLMQLPLGGSIRFSSTGRYLGYLYQSRERVQLLEVTPNREYRTIVSSGGGDKLGSYQEGDISPDGRLLALGMGSAGDRLWELSSGRELAALPSGSICVLFQPDELLTCGPAGLHRWPIQERQEVAHELRLGPPRRIALPFVPHRVARSRDGRTLAIVSEASGAGLLMDLNAGAAAPQHFAHAKAGHVVLSPDGRWLASCGWHSDRVRLWDARTGKMVHEWVLGTQTWVYFTPDSRGLITCRGDAFTFWDVDTLRPVRRLDRDVALYPGYVAFSPDGKLMALEMAPAVIHLAEVATGRTVAKLEDPHGDRAGWMSFTPDGTQLVVTARYARAIHVWDLRAMRDRLKAMGLDWDWPEFGPTDPRAKTDELAKVDVLPGDLDKPALTRDQKARYAIERYRLAVTANPDDAKACNDLAWQYATAPEALRDVKAALPLAEKAVRLDPKNAVYRNTLGVALYRVGRYREAVEILRGNLDRDEDWARAFDLYFLAMSRHHLGETARARDDFDWAARWPRTHPRLTAGHLDELTRFHAEAAELLGVEPKPD